MNNKAMKSEIATACDLRTKYSKRAVMLLPAHGKRIKSEEGVDRIYVLPGGADLRKLSLRDLEALHPAALSSDHQAARNMQIGLLRHRAQWVTR